MNLFGGHFHLELYRISRAREYFARQSDARLDPKPDCIRPDPRRSVVRTHHQPCGRDWPAARRGIGNLLDRLLRAPGPLRGGVVDWIKPTLSGGSLNLADLAINAAVITILVGLTLDWLRQRRHRPGDDPAPA